MIDPVLMIRVSKHCFLLNFDATNFIEFIRLVIFKSLITLPVKILYTLTDTTRYIYYFLFMILLSFSRS